MNTYLARRLLTSLAVLFGVALFTFSILHLVPGDPVVAIVGRQAVAGAQIEELRRSLGLDQPLPRQFVRYVGNALRGDLGQSIRNQQPVIKLIGAQLPATLQLTLLALGFAIIVGGSAGIVAALTHGRWPATLISLLSIGGVSLPAFWLGMLLTLVFAVQLRWLPSSSAQGDWRGLILPALTLGLAEAAVITRVVRASLLDELARPYLITARAKGLAAHTRWLRHALPNALIPVVTLLGLQVGLLLVGAIVIETLFARQGLGRLAVTAINNRDYPLVQGVALVVASAYVIINTLTDLAYGWIDPRIRLE